MLIDEARRAGVIASRVGDEAISIGRVPLTLHEAGC
jgi:hypothetical protein